VRRSWQLFPRSLTIDETEGESREQHTGGGEGKGERETDQRLRGLRRPGISQALSKHSGGLLERTELGKLG